MKKGIKKLIVLAVVIIIAFVLFKVFLTPKTAKIGQTVKYANNAEFVVNNIETNSVGDDKGEIVVTFTLENTGKVDLTVETDKIFADYNKGIKYEAEDLYVQGGNGHWSACPNGVLLEKVTSKPTTFMAVIPVPSKAIEDTDAPLKVQVYYNTYKIR